MTWPSRKKRAAPPIRSRIILIVVALLLVASGLALLARDRNAPQASGPVGLFTTLPILWNEEADVADLLKSSEAPHWARGMLTDRGGIVALDSLAAPGGAGPLANLTNLVMAQPRPLSPDENVALDTWVRSGGRLLLLADPALTEESHFAIGDPRRPQGVVLLSPILKRWGLDLRFDEAQEFGDRTVRSGTLALPVNLPGTFVVIGPAACTIEASGLLATCTIGKGRITALADAALLSREDGDGTRARAFSSLLDRSFAD